MSSPDTTTHPKRIFALDFDGVICHSAVETAYTAWLCAKSLWPEDFVQDEIPDFLSRAFVEVRPFLEYGAEAILMLKLLLDGWSADRFASEFCGRSEAIMAACSVSKDQLKRLFGAKRDEQIATRPDDWLRLNSCYPHSLEALKHLLASGTPVFIITTKQERFADAILANEGIAMPAGTIYGLERKVAKQVILADLADRYPGSRLAFVEDRLPALEAAAAAPLPQERMEFYLACWGYVTPAHLSQAAANPYITLIHSLNDIH